jgi:hypothetical protein
MRRYLILAGIMMAGSVHADYVGYTPSYLVSNDVADPDGPTESLSDFVPISGAVVWDMTKYTRLWTEYHFVDLEINATTENIGQTITSHGALVSYQRKFAWSRSFKPWVGVGLGYDVAEFKGRHTIDVDGYLDQRFDDREVSFMSLHVNVAHEWKVSSDLYWGLYGDLNFANDDAFDGMKFGVSLFYDL